MYIIKYLLNTSCKKLLYLVAGLTSLKPSHEERGKSEFKPHKSDTESLGAS